MIAFGSNTNPSVHQTSSKQFLQILPQIEKQLSFAFRHLMPEARQEAIQDGVVHCFVAYVQLERRGRRDRAFPSTLARFAVHRIREGCNAGCHSNSLDPLSPYAQRKRGLFVQRLDRYRRETAEWLDPLVDDRRASIPDQVAMRIDVPAWLATLTRRLRRIAKDLAVGNSTSEVARKHHVTAGRISQIRRQLDESWHRFHGEGAAAAPATS